MSDGMKEGRTEQFPTPVPPILPYGIPLAFDPSGQPDEPEPDNEDIAHAESRLGEARGEMESSSVPNSDVVAALRIAKDLLTPRAGFFAGSGMTSIKPMDLIMVAEYILHPEDSGFRREDIPIKLPEYPTEPPHPPVYPPSIPENEGSEE